MTDGREKRGVGTFRSSVHSLRAFRFKNVAKMEGLQTEQPQLQICWVKLHVQWLAKGWGSVFGKNSRRSRVVLRELQRTHETTPTTASENVPDNRQWAGVLDLLKTLRVIQQKQEHFSPDGASSSNASMANSHSKVIMNTFIPLISR